MRERTEFEKQVRHELLDRGMSVSDLAHELGVSPAYIYYTFAGDRKGDKLIQKIKEYLGI